MLIKQIHSAASFVETRITFNYFPNEESVEFFARNAYKHWMGR